ncbi:hypothetical protein SteCoe_4141 [Stentor coeruleus]|uniref:RanBP-type and C3HC4-type zinc finger-containing protein 1 n=1 Tax=Stentor coeruleus TaxID=5963 RepID=A0A1R2CV95_9CILI|nr:hypothetical protein SteCoe_4141 [Stentor coeruleus]
MECPKCCSPWNSQERIPRILSCGHSICELCAKELFRDCKIICSSCQCPHIFSVERLFNETDDEYVDKCMSSLSKNFTLLSLISTQALEPESSNEPSFELQFCEEHNLPVHSFTEKPFSLVCDKCIEEIAEYNLVVKPLPEVAHYTSQTIKDISSNLKKQHQECESALEFYSRMTKSEKERAIDMVNEYFSQFYTCLDAAKTEFKSELDQVLEEQIAVNKKAAIALEERNNFIQNIDAQYNYFKGLQDNEIVRYSENFDNLLNKIRQPHDNTELVSVSLTPNKAKVSAISSLLDSSYEFSIKKAVDFWLCERCNLKNVDGCIACTKCSAFRPLTTYPNLLSNPEHTSKQEIHELHLRRQSELQTISELDKNEAQGVFYLIHANWITKWKEFVFNKNQNPGFQAGALPPGPITNHLLFEDSECKVLKLKLKAAMDYRGLNEKVWQAYHRIYGGGPMIVRKRLNIYDEPKGK